MDRIQHLNQVIDTAIDNAENLKSKLIASILGLEGMSGIKGRHFLNNLIYEGSRYLEIGSWKGSTLCSALYKNKPEKSFCIENYSQFGGHEELHENIKKFVNNDHSTIICDSFSVDIKENDISDIDIYFYDGAHGLDDHTKALEYFIDAMKDTFIFVVDDWNGTEARDGSFASIENLKLKTLRHDTLPDKDTLFAASRYDSVKEGYWNGLGIFILQK